MNSSNNSNISIANSAIQNNNKIDNFFSQPTFKQTYSISVVSSSKINSKKKDNKKSNKTLDNSKITKPRKITNNSNQVLDLERLVQLTIDTITNQQTL
ncbi:hypothetical protein ABK040_014743 [Willaertia magna]